MQLLVRLLRDAEAEVRMQATAQIPFVGEGMKTSDRVMLMVTNIVPIVVELVNDASQHVRVAVASVLSDLAPIRTSAQRRPLAPFQCPLVTIQPLPLPLPPASQRLTFRPSVYRQSGRSGQGEEPGAPCAAVLAAAQG